MNVTHFVYRLLEGAQFGYRPLEFANVAANRLYAFVELLQVLFVLFDLSAQIFKGVFAFVLRGLELLNGRLHFA